ETGGWNTVIETNVIAAASLLAQPVGTIGNHDRGNAQPLYPFQVPEIQPGTKRGFFLQRHLRNEFDDIFHGYAF
ncbi:MAG: hypothetical protein WBG94_16160, partial [Anaerolineales bacterium]